RAALASGRAEEGATALRAALFGAPADGSGPPVLTVALARLLLRAGQPDDAAAVLESGPAALAADREALLLAAEVQVERGDRDSAEALVLTALQADPRDAEAAAWLAELSVRRGRAEEAADRAAGILAERPGTERALLVRAVALAELGRTAAAREAFQALVSESSGPAFHWANFAAFEAASGRAPEAVRLYREAVDRDPSNLTAYRGLLEAATRAGDDEQVRRAREVLGGR
ncbi:MAG: tetratricopeptide repeat protein, partial [Acidobacteriota bacterium]|nr:tetratricopeptide repeat protein [Acidobacteriota bacterium]